MATTIVANVHSSIVQKCRDYLQESKMLSCSQNTCYAPITMVLVYLWFPVVFVCEIVRPKQMNPL